METTLLQLVAALIILSFLLALVRFKQYQTPWCLKAAIFAYFMSVVVYNHTNVPQSLRQADQPLQSIFQPPPNLVGNPHEFFKEAVPEDEPPSRFAPVRSSYAPLFYPEI